MLEAMDRRGRLTPTRAALETSLGTEEAAQMLFDLAAQGHIELSVEDGRLVYSFWGKQAA